jgi:hypothetical protein
MLIQSNTLFYALQVGIHILIFFLANLANGNMSVCHHLVPVMCHPFTFHILIFSSENPQQNELKVGRKHLWEVLSEECTFCYDPLANKVLSKECTYCYDPLPNKVLSKECTFFYPLPNMAITGNSYFWLADFKNNLLLWSRLAKWTVTW